MTQGSSFLATLGLGTESRWDSNWPRSVAAAAGVVFSGHFFCRTQIQSRETKTCRRGDRQPRRKTHVRPARKTGGGSGEVK